MKNTRINFFLSLSVFIYFGCGGMDVIVDLGNGYYYFGEGTPNNYIFMGYKEKSGFEYSIDKRIIEENVSSFVYDNDYILVLQVPDYDTAVYNLMMKNHKGAFYSDDEREIELKKADSIFKLSPYWNKIFNNKQNYYIIDKKYHKVYGPLTKKSYLQVKDSIGINNKLNLN